MADRPTSRTGGPVHNVPGDVHHDHHGNSTAAWALSGLVMLGALIMCLAVVLSSVPLAVAGGLVVIAGVVAGKVLSSMGYGIAGRGN